MNKYEVLKKYFGYDTFRNAQEKLIDNILEGKDTLCRLGQVSPCVIRYRL